jgi:hypothetical protein
MLTVFRALQQVIEIDPAQAETKEASGSRIPLTSAPSMSSLIGNCLSVNGSVIYRRNLGELLQSLQEV